jgi:tetratricopeptide (TPR) repeat protein
MTGLVNVMKIGSAPVFALAFLLATLMVFLIPVSAAGDFSASASSSPPVVTVKDQVSLTINITNKGTVTYQTLVLQVFIYPDSATPGTQLQPDKTLSNFGPGGNGTIRYDFVPETADVYSITVKMYNGTATNPNYLDQLEVTNVFQAKSVPPPAMQELPVMLIVAGVLAAVIVVAAVVGAVIMKKRKAALEAEAAQKAAAVYRAPEPADKIHGKFPKDYYKFRREKLNKLKPIGLTRGGFTILGNIDQKVVEDSGADGPVCKTCCPKCSVEMSKDWKTCKNCGAKRTIERAEEMLKKLEAAGDDVGNFRQILSGAETERTTGNYDEAETYAHDVLDKARSELKRHDDAKKQSEAAEEAVVSYGEGAQVTKEEEPHAEKGYSREEEAARDYADSSVGAKGYDEPASTKEYSAAPAQEPSATGDAPAVEEPLKIKRPEKKEGSSCHQCGQALKPEWKKCPYCGAIQEGICTGCGRTVKMKWNVCPQCRTDFQKQPPKPACPACGVEMAEGAECHSCKARSLMDSTSRLVREVKGKGADVMEAEALIGRGELALKIKNYEKAVGHFQHADEIARRSRREFRIRRLTERIDHARSLARDSAELGADVGESMRLIDRASAALSEEKFEEGMNHADKATVLAEQALDRVVDGKEKERAEKAKIPVSVRKPVIIGQVKVNPRCPHCQEFVEETWPACPACQTPLVWICPKCGSAVKPEWKVCPACETTLR